MAPKSLDAAFALVRAAATHLPEVEESTSYGTPALKVRGKSFVRLKDAETLVVMCAIDEKECVGWVKRSADPTPSRGHATCVGSSLTLDPTYKDYKGWPAVLVRLSRISTPKLRHPPEKAWRIKAPKRLIARFDSKR